MFLRQVDSGLCVSAGSVMNVGLVESKDTCGTLYTMPGCTHRIISPTHPILRSRPHPLLLTCDMRARPEDMRHGP